MTPRSILDLYTRFFGLTRRPFALVPDPNFLFWSEHHRRAYSMLEYGILTRAPITLVTGEIGVGKSTLLFHLLDHVGEDLCVGLVTNAHGNRGELIHWVLQSLGLSPKPEESYVQLFARLQDHLILEYAGGRRVVLIFDEAQNLSRESLEELRMFTIVNSRTDELLQLVLVGQPELIETVRQPSLRQFAQLVASSVHLPAMGAPMVKAYLDHRLHIAGAQDEIFTAEAASLIHRTTGGVSRLINQLADLSLVYAYTSEMRSVDEILVQKVIDEGTFLGVRNPDIGDDLPPQNTGLRKRSQGMAAAVQLPAMDARLAKLYLEHRLRSAGARDVLFTYDVAELIVRKTDGVVRLIDQLANLAMVYAYASDARQVDPALVEQVLEDGLFPPQRDVGDKEKNLVLTLRSAAE